MQAYFNHGFHPCTKPYASRTMLGVNVDMHFPQFVTHTC